MFDIKQFKNEIKKQENVLHYLRENYEQISNIPNKGYGEKYDLVKIAKSKKLKTIKINKYEDIDIYEFEIAPKNIVIIYNHFDEVIQDKIELFV